MYYIYAHLRKTDCSVFYIGKGSGKRAFAKNGRNPMWQSIFKKHGCYVVILSKWENEDDAYKEECRVIQEIGIENLANLTHGGKGPNGIKISDEQKERARIHLAQYNKKQIDLIFIQQRRCKKRIYVESGRSFLGAEKVVKWMSEELGIHDATRTGVSHAASKGAMHKGVKLRYRDVKFQPTPDVGVRARAVGDSLGNIYPSIRRAVEELAKLGIKTTSASIVGAMNGSSVTAGGRRWGYVIDGEVKIIDFPRRTKYKRIERSDGVIFNSLQEAAAKTKSHPNAHKNISLCALGKTKTAYGYNWRYLDDSTS